MYPTGRWDGIEVRDGRFAGFYALNSPGGTDYAEARAKLRARAGHRPRRGNEA